MVDLQKNAAAMVKVRDEFIKEPYPAATWIGITELAIPGARAEIKVIARKLWGYFAILIGGNTNTLSIMIAQKQ